MMAATAVLARSKLQEYTFVILSPAGPGFIFPRNSMKLTLEIHPAEGGDDAKLLTHDQAAIYKRFAIRNGIAVSTESRGFL
jgi:protein subunit release factor A